jgi:hypothetical protein
VQHLHELPLDRVRVPLRLDDDEERHAGELEAHGRVKVVRSVDAGDPVVQSDGKPVDLVGRRAEQLDDELLELGRRDVCGQRPERCRPAHRLVVAGRHSIGPRRGQPLLDRGSRLRG